MEEQKEFKEFTNFDPTKDLSLAPQRRTKRGSKESSFSSRSGQTTWGIIQYLQKIRKRI